MGVVPGNRVLLRSPNSPMLAACWFAVMKVGAIAVTTMPLLRAKGHCGTHRLQLVGDRYTLIAADTRPAALVFIAAKGAIDWPALEAALG